MKNLPILIFVILDAALLVLSLVLMLAGWLVWGGVALAAAGGLVFAAAWFWRGSPEPVPAAVDELLDPVDVHQAQMARVLDSKPLGGK